MTYAAKEEALCLADEKKLSVSFGGVITAILDYLLALKHSTLSNSCIVIHLAANSAHHVQMKAMLSSLTQQWLSFSKDSFMTSHLLDTPSSWDLNIFLIGLLGLPFKPLATYVH